MVLFSMIHQVFIQAHFVAAMAFHAKVSDPVIGGTYMTLLNTVVNLGGHSTGTLALYFVDKLSSFECHTGSAVEISSKALQQQCEDQSGLFVTSYDGYYVEAIICTTFGFFWFVFMKGYILYLDALPTKEWRVKEKGATFLATVLPF